MKNKKGISLITLVITIIIIVVLAGAIIINLANNNIIGNAEKAKEASEKTTVSEEVRLAVYDLLMDENKEEMTQEMKRTYLEDKLKKYDSSSTVEISDTGFIANHREYVFEISGGYEISIKETGTTFNAEEWDKTATPDEYFEWDETGTIIIGYKNTLANSEKIRIPSKCVAIEPSSVWQSNQNRTTTTTGIKKIELPDTITVIGNYTFADFRSVEEINIPNGVTSIGREAFASCKGLTSITIPDGVTDIGEYAFYGCSSLTSIIIPDGVTSIGGSTFSYCTGLTSIIIPDGVNSLGDLVFAGCTGISNIIIPNSVTTMGGGIFSGWKSNQTIYCVAENKPDGWHDYWDGTYKGHAHGTYIFTSDREVNIVWGYTEE